MLQVNGANRITNLTISTWVLMLGLTLFTGAAVAIGKKVTDVNIVDKASPAFSCEHMFDGVCSGTAAQNMAKAEGDDFVMWHRCSEDIGDECMTVTVRNPKKKMFSYAVIDKSCSNEPKTAPIAKADKTAKAAAVGKIEYVVDCYGGYQVLYRTKRTHTLVNNPDGYAKWQRNTFQVPTVGGKYKSWFRVIESSVLSGYDGNSDGHAYTNTVEFIDPADDKVLESNVWSVSYTESGNEGNDSVDLQCQQGVIGEALHKQFNAKKAMTCTTLGVLSGILTNTIQVDAGVTSWAISFNFDTKSMCAAEKELNDAQAEVQRIQTCLAVDKQTKALENLNPETAEFMLDTGKSNAKCDFATWLPQVKAIKDKNGDHCVKTSVSLCNANCNCAPKSTTVCVGSP